MRIRTTSRHEHGIALIAALLMLVVLGIMSIAMFRNFGLTEKKAGTTAEKQRAFQAAQSALDFGEWWLANGNSINPAVNCTTLVTASQAAAAASPGQICSNALANPLAVPWSSGMAYVPAEMTVASGGGLDANGNPNYQAAPQIYIRSAGYAADGRALFEVTAAGFGAAPDTVAVVQSTFGMGVTTKNLGDE